MVGIYRIVNKLSGKSYIGQSIHCGKRFDEHTKGKQLIDQIIQVEGVENFTFELLKECDTGELSYWEDYYIIKYNTMYPNGYNKRWNCSEEIRGEIESEIVESKSEDKIKSERLTPKQYMIYYYLISISKKVENNYCIEKSSFDYKNACKELCIDLGTWRSALRKLYECGYIFYEGEWFTNKSGKRYYKEKSSNKKYIIYFESSISIPLISHLIDFGKEINNHFKTDLGGLVIPIYNFLKVQSVNQNCVNITQISSLFNSNRTKKRNEILKSILDYFSSSGLIDCEIETKINNLNKPYSSYKILGVNLGLPKDLENKSQYKVKLISEEDRELLKERMNILWSSLSDQLK